MALRDAGAFVLNRQDGATVPVAHAQADRSSWRRVDNRVLHQEPPDLEHPLGISDRAGAVPRRDLERMVVRERHRAELLGHRLRERPELEDLLIDADPAGVETREVEEIGREPREPIDLLPHSGEELSARLLVQLLVVHQLQEAAKREQGRPQLVRCVGDELLAGIVELGQAQAHAIERAGKLTELILAVVDHGLVKAPRRDPLGCPLKPLDPAREDPRSAVADTEGNQKSNEPGDQQAPLDDVDRSVLRGQGRDEQDGVLGARVRNRDLGVRAMFAQNGAALDPIRRLSTQSNWVGRESFRGLPPLRVVGDRQRGVSQVVEGRDLRIDVGRLRLGELAWGLRLLVLVPEPGSRMRERLDLSVDQAILERRHHHEVDDQQGADDHERERDREHRADAAKRIHRSRKR